LSAGSRWNWCGGASWTILTKAGVPRHAELVCYSEDPGEAAVNYFILKLMGFPDVKVLVG
jgi:3-mercaptopyruvate sulfurtransferase SseA